MINTKTIKDMMYPRYRQIRDGIRSKRINSWINHREKASIGVLQANFGVLKEKYESNIDPIVISFGTEDGIYDVCLDKLKESARANRHAVSTATIPKSSSVFALRFKPSFIKYQLLTLKRPVLWVDADSLLKDHIDLPHGNWDTGAFFTGNKYFGKEVISAECLAFRPTLRAISFLNLWEFMCVENRMGDSDHPDLLTALDAYKERVDIVDIHNEMTGNLVRGKLGKLTVHI